MGQAGRVAGVGVRQYLAKGSGEPNKSRRSVMAIIGIAVPEEIRQVACASILKKVRGRNPADHVRDLRPGARLKLHKAPDARPHIGTSSHPIMMEVAVSK